MAINKKRVAAIEKRIVPIEEADPYLKVLVYGRHGTGKTRFAASAPKVLIVDINEKGTKSARNFHGGKVFPVRTWEDVVYAYWYLRTTDHDFEAVAIDSMTAMQHLCMKWVLGEQEDRDPNREASMPSRQTWGKLSEVMKEQILRYRNLPMHVIFTAQERVMGDEDEAREHVPDLSPGIRGTAMGAVDVIGRTYQKEVRKAKKVGDKKKVVKVWEPRMLLGPHDEFEGKDRIYELGRVVSNPTVPLMIDALQSSLNGEEE